MSGRPPKEINWQLFEDLCSIQCTQSEIASVLHFHVDTIRDRAQAHYEEEYSNIYKRFSESGKTSLRRTQFKLAQKSPAMAIFLGKQYLGQKDNHDTVLLPPEMIASYNKLMMQLANLQAKAAQKRDETLLQAVT